MNRRHLPRSHGEHGETASHLEDAKSAKGSESLKKVGFNQKEFAVLRDLRGSVVKEVLL